MLSFKTSVRGGRCDYSSWASPPP